MPRPFFFDGTEIKPPTARTRKQARTHYDCSICGLDRGCKSPKMEPHGKNELHIAIVAEAPGAEEDKLGIPLVGRAGQFTRDSLDKLGLDLDRDFAKLNIIQCRPAGNRDPSQDEIRCCRPRVAAQLKTLKPNMIIAFGSAAIAELLGDAPFGPSATMMHGRIVPSPRWGCWVACGFHPSWYIRQNGRYDRWMDEFLSKALLHAAEVPFEDQRLDESKYELVEHIDQVEALLGDLGLSKDPVAFDYEATCISPWTDKSKLLTMAFATSPSHGWCVPLGHPQARWSKSQLEQIYNWLRFWLKSNCPKVIQNLAMEETWSRVKLGTSINNVICDTMVREHVIDNRQGVCGQEFQTYIRYGSTYKSKVNIAALEREPLDRVANYNVLDTRYLIQWYNDQNSQMNSELERAYALFHEALPVMIELKIRGVQLDMAAMDSLDAEVKGEFAKIDQAAASPAVQQYQRKHHKPWNQNSNKAKQELFFDIMGLEPLKLTKHGKDLGNPSHCSTDAETVTYLLGQVGPDSDEAVLLRACTDYSHLKKLCGYIDGYRDLKDANDRMHPSFNLHTAESYRSSSTDPNFQNIPVRNPKLARLRRVFVPTHDWFLELDLGGAEVCGMGCNSLDKNLIRYIKEGVDFHLKYSALLHEKPASEINKTERYDGKSGFVFPEFYGSYWKTIAREHPEWRAEQIKFAEEEFWRDLSGVRRWQEATEKFYLEHGYLQFLTGFQPRFGKKHGPFSKNQICNYPVQGFSFHRLLKVLLVVEAEMRRRGMVSVICGQIHDSIVTDVVDGELDDVVALQDEVIRRPMWKCDAVVPWTGEFKIGKNLWDMEAI